MKAAAAVALAVLASAVTGNINCAEQDRFDILMCNSHMCTNCTLDWCMESCQKLQLDFPDCRCAGWASSRSTYSEGQFQMKGKYGDVGDYGR
mmetsp:Transcript_122976/g.358938  ORF Transcript_122976/g.358938 Transcript_122976/m.358938 type:complete len:92 (+) Transcript_122976:88-363(+)